MVKKDVFVNRRETIMGKMSAMSAAVVRTAPVCRRNGDVNFDYRPNSDFYYLTGFSEPEAVLVLLVVGRQKRTILFNRVRDEAHEIWDGPRLGQDGAKRHCRVDEAYPIDELAERMPTLLADVTRVYCSYSDQTDVADDILDWAQPLNNARGQVNTISEVVNLDPIIHQQRLRKKPEEIQRIKRACDVTAQAHVRAMRTVKPGMMEYELEAELRHEFIRQGCRQQAYGAIVGGGANACILHYVDNNQQLNDGDLVLIDAGAEYDNYASDVTRTFPVNGKFTDAQKNIYELVLKAQLAVIRMIKPGVQWHKLQEKAVKILTQGLVDLGLLRGTVAQLIKEGAYQKFYMHGIGHWLGMDVHDVGSYKVNNKWRPLEAGMVFTVEPGLYISEQKGVPKKYCNIGVRIEDDVLVTKNGCDVLSHGVPKTVKDIEQLMASA